AMAYHRLGRAAQAEKNFKEVVQWMEMNAQQQLPWQVRLDLQLLRQEAEALLGENEKKRPEPQRPPRSESEDRANLNASWIRTAWPSATAAASVRRFRNTSISIRSWPTTSASSFPPWSRSNRSRQTAVPPKRPIQPARYRRCDNWATSALSARSAGAAWASST